MADTPGTEALTRALHEAAGRTRRGTLRTKVYPGPQFAARILAALSPADRLAIAGITEDRLANALHVTDIASLVFRGEESEHERDARAILAALLSETAVPRSET